MSRVEELRRSSRTAVSAESSDSVSGYRTDVAAGNFSDSVVRIIGNVDIAATINGNAGRIIETDRSRHAVTGVSGIAIAGNSRDSARRVDFADPVIERIRYVDIARRVDGNAFRTIQSSVRGWTTIPAESGYPHTRNCRRRCGQQDLSADEWPVGCSRCGERRDCNTRKFRNLERQPENFRREHRIERRNDPQSEWSGCSVHALQLRVDRYPADECGFGFRSDRVYRRSDLVI